MARPKALRYTVDGSDKSYAEVGPALSLSITLAMRAADEGRSAAFYVRDSIGGKILGFSESQAENGVRPVIITVRR